MNWDYVLVPLFVIGVVLAASISFFLLIVWGTLMGRLGESFLKRMGWW